MVTNNPEELSPFLSMMPGKWQVLINAGGMRSGCGLPGSVARSGRSGLRRVSAVPHIIPGTYVSGPSWRDCSGMTVVSKVFSCFPFWGAPQDVHRVWVTGGISLASPPCHSRGHCHLSDNGSQLWLGGLCLGVFGREICWQP